MQQIEQIVASLRDEAKQERQAGQQARKQWGELGSQAGKSIIKHGPSIAKDIKGYFQSTPEEEAKPDWSSATTGSPTDFSKFGSYV